MPTTQVRVLDRVYPIIHSIPDARLLQARFRGDHCDAGGGVRGHEDGAPAERVHPRGTDDTWPSRAEGQAARTAQPPSGDLTSDTAAIVGIC